MKAKLLDQKAKALFKTWNTAHAELLNVISEIDETRSYLELGYSSLWDYVTRELDMTPHQAHQFVSVTRKAKEVPILKEKVLQGEITLTKAALIVPELKAENQELWLAKAETNTAREIKEAITEAQGKQKFIEVKLKLTPEEYAELQKAQDILSQKIKKSATAEETVMGLVKTYVTKQDKPQKAVRLLRTSKVNLENIPFGRVLPAQVKHHVFAKSQGQCEALNPDGTRCENKRFLEIHHKHPISQGGSNHPTNLILLCSGHHKGQHIKQKGQATSGQGSDQSQTQSSARQTIRTN